MKKFSYLLFGMLGLVLLTLSCSGGGSGESSGNSESGVSVGGEPAPPSYQKIIYTTNELINLAKSGSEIALDEASLQPYNYQTADNGGTYSINIRIKSAENKIGLSVYFFSSKAAGVNYNHADKWQVMSRDNSPAADEVSKKNQLPQMVYNKLFGSSLNNPQQFLGELTLTTPINNEMIFVVKTYNEAYANKF